MIDECYVANTLTSCGGKTTKQTYWLRRSSRAYPFDLHLKYNDGLVLIKVKQLSTFEIIKATAGNHLKLITHIWKG